MSMAREDPVVFWFSWSGASRVHKMLGFEVRADGVARDGGTVP
jgi:hypothetical protein